jgi:hypothetical protein
MSHLPRSVKSTGWSTTTEKALSQKYRLLKFVNSNQSIKLQQSNTTRQATFEGGESLTHPYSRTSPAIPNQVYIQVALPQVLSSIIRSMLVAFRRGDGFDQYTLDATCAMEKGKVQLPGSAGRDWLCFWCLEKVLSYVKDVGWCLLGVLWIVHELIVK